MNMKWPAEGDSKNHTKWSGSMPAPKYNPKRVVRSFRDLEVYRITLDNSASVEKYILPALVELGYSHVQRMQLCALGVPLRVAQAHGQRFDTFATAVATLEAAMQGCNQVIVYLDHVRELYPKDVDVALVEDLMKKYITARGKMVRLEKSWKQFQARG